MLLGLVGPDEPTCSRSNCTAVASYRVSWRNPKIHPVDRVKIWLSCDEHREFLVDYLSSRGFPVEASKIEIDQLD